MAARSIEQVRNLCKRRGFVFPGSAAYGGLGSFWDYGPLGTEMLSNVKRAWWRDVVYKRDDVEGLDAAILMSRKVWQHSGHEATFSDPLVDNKKTKKRYRLDHLLAEQKTPILLRLVRSSTVWKWIEANRSREICQQLEAAFKAWNSRVRSEAVGFDAIVIDRIELADRLLAEDFERRHRSSLVSEVVYPLLREAGATGQDLTQSGVLDPADMQVGDWTDTRLFNLMFRTHVGPVEIEHYSREIAESDKLNFEAIAPEHERYVASDSSLSDDDKRLRIALLDAWKYRIDALELAMSKGDESSRVYLRPETAQGIFMNFAHVQRSLARKVPFGIAQVGKAFRNEITPGNFIFRTREFEQMEIEFFIKPPQFVRDGEKTDVQWHDEWVKQRYEWWIALGIDAQRLRKREQSADELAHYSKATVDLEYLFPEFGWGEVEGIANRTDYDLSAHSRDIPEADLKRLKLEPNTDSVEKFDYFDPDVKARYIPWVIEPSAGATRAMLAFLCEAYHEELTKDPPQAEVEAIKAEIPAVVKNAQKKAKEAEKKRSEFRVPSSESTPANSEPGTRNPEPEAAKHNPEHINAFCTALEDAANRLPQSLLEIDALLSEHPGAQNLEPVKKLQPKVNKLAEDCARVVLKLHPSLAPIKLAVFPLKKNKPELVDIARRIAHTYQPHFRTVYDDSAGIGRLYRRQDEIGTPWCVTVDFQTLEDNTVTVRERDSMQQQRISLEALRDYFFTRIHV